METLHNVLFLYNPTRPTLRFVRPGFSVGFSVCYFVCKSFFEFGSSTYSSHPQSPKLLHICIVTTLFSSNFFVYGYSDHLLRLIKTVRVCMISVELILLVWGKKHNCSQNRSLSKSRHFYTIPLIIYMFVLIIFAKY